jgi:hypothetical protein
MDRVLLCPHCRCELLLRGAVAGESSLPRRFNAWHCLVHGGILQEDENRADPEPATGTQDCTIKLKG